MNTIDNIYSGYQRLQADKQNRSNAINSAIIERDRKIKHLRNELRFALRCMVIVLAALVAATGYMVWRAGQ